MERKCQTCGESLKKGNAKFCSSECYAKSVTKERYTKECGICGEEFITKRKEQCYCSMKCLGISKRVVKEIKSCQLCGKDLPLGNARFCSIECYGISRRMKEQTKECEICGEKFVTKRKEQRYCSMECVGESKVTVKPLQTCDYCGETFRKADSRFRNEKRFCNIKCATKAISQARVNKKEYSRTCLGCGKIITQELTPGQYKLFKNKKYCSQVCCNIHRRKEEKVNANRRTQENKTQD